MKDLQVAHWVTLEADHLADHSVNHLVPQEMPPEILKAETDCESHLGLTSQGHLGPEENRQDSPLMDCRLFP